MLRCGDIPRRASYAALAQLRAIATGSIGCQAAPALAESSASSQGWLSSLFGGSSRISIPLTDPLPGVNLPHPVQPPSKAPATETSTLANGIKVASEDTVVRCMTYRLSNTALLQAHRGHGANAILQGLSLSSSHL